jgi:succinate dehydrogenase / fumarate reductase cytochrome b subunit
VIPIGAFLCFHLLENARALQGRQQFDEAVASIGHVPYVPFLEWGVILLPLGFHAGFGVKLAFAGKPSLVRYPYTYNWMYVLQRATGILALAFVGFHLYEFFVQKLIGKLAPDQFYPALSHNMSSTVGPVPVVALVYILGIAACAFHFANGLSGFCFSWGLTVSRRSQRLAGSVFGVLALVLFFLGANTTIYFATGSGVFQSRSSDPYDGASAAPETVGGVSNVRPTH